MPDAFRQVVDTRSSGSLTRQSGLTFRSIRARKRLPCAGAPPRNRIRSSHTYPLPHYYTTFCIAAEMYTLLLPGSKKASDFSEALGSQHFLCCYFTSFFVERNAVDPNIAAPFVPQIRIISYNFSSKSASFKSSTLPPQDSATVPDVWQSLVPSGIDTPSGSQFQIAPAESARSAGQFLTQTASLSIAPACIWSHSG